jgi:hypothetical protein
MAYFNAISERSKPDDGHSTASDLATNAGRGSMLTRQQDLVARWGHWQIGVATT